MLDCDGIPALRRLSASIGRDPALVQGAGGNVSIKIGDTLWVKASGTWLADAEDRDILLPVALTGDGGYRAPEGSPAGLRPSIETSLHAALPHAVVLHVHSVDAIAHAVRTDAADILADRLSGLAWALIPYRRPGPPLTEAIREALANGPADVLILANHGLVVAADTVAAAETLLRDVVARLAIAPRAPAPDRAAGPAVAGYHRPDDPIVQSLARDVASRMIATAGPLYPDHVVFLGPAPLVVDDSAQILPALEGLKAQDLPRPRWILVRGLEILLADDALAGSAEMLRCLGDVAARLPHDAPLAVLGADDIAALTDWDAERYRQALAAARHDHAAPIAAGA